jgi:hypothetical protein
VKLNYSKVNEERLDAAIAQGPVVLGKLLNDLKWSNEPPAATERATGQRGAIEWMNPRDLEADGTPRDYRDPQEKP